VTGLVRKAAENVLVAAALANLPPGMRGPAEVALRSLGFEAVRRVSQAIVDAAQMEYRELFRPGADRAPTLSEINHATVRIARRAMRRLSADAAMAMPPSAKRRRALVQVIVAVVFIVVGGLVQVGVIIISPSNSHSRAIAGAAAPEIDHAIDEVVQQALSGVMDLAADAVVAAFAGAVPPEMRGQTKAALHDLGSQMASVLRSAIADAAQTARKQIDGTNTEPGHK
jgi:hypothetical protein